jgi:hypothetical protein
MGDTLTAAGIPTGGRDGKVVHIQNNNRTHGEKQYKNTEHTK